MSETPHWIPLLFGSVAICMGVLILGAAVGLVPTDSGRFLAPPTIILGLGAGLVLSGIMLCLPATTPAVLRSGLFLLTLAMVAVVCNWSAFAPEVVYHSSTSLGPISFVGADQVGGRVAFGIAAIVVDLFLLATISGWLRSGFKRSGRPSAKR